MATNAQDQLFRGLHGNPAAINNLADNYEKVANHLERSQRRLDAAADELQAMKGKSFDSLQAHVGRLLTQYQHAAAHFTKTVAELRAYAKKLELAQDAATTARTQYLTAISTLPDAFTGSTTPVPTHLLHATTYPDTPVDTAGWPPTALGVAGALNTARAQWHQAKTQKSRAADAAHDAIDASALLQALGDPHDTAAGGGDGKGGKAHGVAAAGAALAGAAAQHVAQQHKKQPKPGSKAAKKANAREDYRSAAAAVDKKYAGQKKSLAEQVAAAKASGDTKEADRLQSRLDLVDERAKHERDLAKERRDDRIDRIDGKYDAKEERQEARADAKEAKHLANEQHRLDHADAQAQLDAAVESGDLDGAHRAQQQLQLVDDRHDFQTHAADLRLKSSLAHIELHQHPGAHPAQAAHHLLQLDKHVANANFADRKDLADRGFALDDARIEAKADAAQHSGDEDLAAQLQQHREQLAAAHTQRLQELAQNHAERLDTLQHNFDTAHPHAASAHGAVLEEAHAGVLHATAHLAKLPQAEWIDKAFHAERFADIAERA